MHRWFYEPIIGLRGPVGGRGWGDGDLGKVRGELGVGLTTVLGGGGASSAVGQTGGVEGRCGGITGSLVLVLAVCMGRGRGGPQSMCELSGGVC